MSECSKNKEQELTIEVALKSNSSSVDIVHFFIYVIFMDHDFSNQLLEDAEML